MNNIFKFKFYNFFVLGAFLFSAIAEFGFRQGGGFTLAAFIFYGIFHIIVKFIDAWRNGELEGK